jgi:hypothetical protein
LLCFVLCTEMHAEFSLLIVLACYVFSNHHSLSRSRRCCILWHQYIYKSCFLDGIQSQLNPVDTSSCCFLKIVELSLIERGRKRLKRSPCSLCVPHLKFWITDRFLRNFVRTFPLQNTPNHTFHIL